MDYKIVFATTTLYTECLNIQQDLIQKYFPESKRILVDGSNVTDWPNSMFKWIDEAKKIDSDWTIHIDEDCFLIGKEEVEEVIHKMEKESIDIMGCPDGYHAARPCNPIAINPFFMICKTSSLHKLQHNFSDLKYFFKFNNINSRYMWKNSANIYFKHSYKENFFYKHTKNDMFTFEDGKEPYYPLFWHALDLGLKIDYFYPKFDTDLLTTNPCISEYSKDIAIHMWESRSMKNDKQFYGRTAKERFDKIKNYLKERGIIK